MDHVPRLVATARARAVAGGGIAGIPKAATKVGTKVGERAAGVGEAGHRGVPKSGVIWSDLG